MADVTIADLRSQLATAQAAALQARADRVATYPAVRAAEGTSAYDAALAAYQEADARYSAAYQQIQSLNAQIAALQTANGGQDTASNQITNAPPQTPPATTASDSLSAAEQNNLKTKQINATPPSKLGNEVTYTDPIIPDILKSNQTSKTTSDDKTVPPNTNPDTEYKGSIPNPLSAYPSYTYSLSLHMLTCDEYNTIVKDQSFTPNRVIIASGGRYNNTPGANQFIRAPYFDQDFYFENLDLDTIIGLNEHSRASNAINIKFTVIEPYGVTLLDRLIALTQDIDSANENYLDQPYLLQIDFFASDDTGQIVGIVPNQTKKIPIRILGMKIKVSAKGAEYAFEAAPYNHSAYDLATVSTPAHFEVVAGSVAAFFQSTEADVASTEAELTAQRQLEQSQNLRTNSGTYNGQAGGYIGPDGQITYVNQSLLNSQSQRAAQNISSSDPVYRVKSYGAAINTYQDELEKTNKVTYADTYYFQFDPEIGAAKFDLNTNLGPKDVPMVDVANTVAARNSNATQISILNMDYKTKLFSVAAGTSVEMLLNYVIRNSSYIQSQMTIPEDYVEIQAFYDKKITDKTKPLKWFKIIPTIELDSKRFDKVRKQWARKITYHVVTYEVYNTKISVAPQATWNDPLKEYEYIYTGKNVDILDFNIEFNALYYTAVTAYRSNLVGVSGASDDTTRKIKNAAGYEGQPGTGEAIQPTKEKPQIIDARNRATGGSDTPKAVAAADTQQSLYTTAGGDMLQADIKIIGDPMYIKQDDVFYPPETMETKKNASDTSIDPRLIANGSLRMDNRELYIKIDYKTPSDIDESTGMMSYDSRFRTSSFSGMYKVLRVVSNFERGMFSQQLSTIRLPRQNEKAAVTDQRQVDNTASTISPSNKAITWQPPTSGVDYPDYNNTKTAAVKSTSTTEDPAPSSKPVNDTPPPATTEAQAKLADVNATAPTQDISSQNQPQATVPGPQPETPLPEGVTIDPGTGNYLYKGAIIPGSRKDLAAGISAIDNGTTSTYTVTNPSTGALETRTFNGAAAAEAASPVGQAQSVYETKLESLTHSQQLLAANPASYGSVEDGQKILAIKQANLEKAQADLAAAKAAAGK